MWASVQGREIFVTCTPPSTKDRCRVAAPLHLSLSSHAVSPPEWPCGEERGVLSRFFSRRTWEKRLSDKPTRCCSIGCWRRNCSAVQDDGGLSGDALNILRSNTDSSCLQDGGKHPASEFKKAKILLVADSDVEVVSWAYNRELASVMGGPPHQ